MAATETLSTTSAPEANGAAEKKSRLPQVPQVFNTPEEALEGQKVAIKAGYKKAAVKRHRITSADGKIVRVALGYGKTNAASKVAELMGLKIESLDSAERAPSTPASLLSGFSSMSAADQAMVLKELEKAMKRR